jgi:hypothetical protein
LFRRVGSIYKNVSLKLSFFVLGEYVVKAEELTESLNGADCGPSCDLPLGDLSLPLPEFLLDEALRLVELDDTPQVSHDRNDLEFFSRGLFFAGGH